MSGRPTKFNTRMCPRVYKLALLGATDAQIADFLGISTATLDAWKNEHPRFLSALKRGKDAADAMVAKSLYHRALGYKHKAVKIFADPKTGAEKIVEYVEHYAPDTTACIFWLKNRQRAAWRDRVDAEITGKDGGPIETKNLSDEDLAREVAFALASGLEAQDRTH
jgi:hypothetical protein